MRVLGIVPLFTALTCTRCEVPADYIVDKSTGLGYKLMYTAQTWPIARDHCTDDSAKLAVPKTADQFSFIQNLVRSMHYPSIIGSQYQLVVWLGINNLQDYRIWRNIDGENIEDTGFHRWAGDNGQGYSDAPEEPHCAGVDAVNSGLRDFWCHQRQPYMCQIDLNINN